MGSSNSCPPIHSPQLQSRRYYILNHCVKILHVRLGGANCMHPLSWEAQMEKMPKMYERFGGLRRHLRFLSSKILQTSYKSVL